MDYFEIYLAGCALVAILIPIKLALNYALAWITKENVFYKNLSKLQLTDDNQSPMRPYIEFLTVYVLEVAISWINVPIVLWQIFRIVLEAVRHSMTPVPEEVQLLRYPLKNNPDLSRESVWAYASALGVKAGGVNHSPSLIAYDLHEMSEAHSRFKPRLALKQLGELGVYSDHVMKEIAEEFDELGRLDNDSLD